MFRFGKRTTKKNEPVVFDEKFTDEKCYGNTSEILKSIRNDKANAVIAAINECDSGANIDPNKLDEDELDYFAQLGFVIELMALGYHAGAEDIANLSEAH